nr:hypothetical protein [Tanacetum cinerariifolium]
IEFGDSYKVPTNTDPDNASTRKDDELSRRTVTIITEDMERKKNDVKVVILKTFGGNKATKKRKKNLLKQQYGNFKAEGSETLEQTFNRLQVIVSQLHFMDVEVEKDDLNQKFLTSLAPEWLMHTIVWRNRNDLDTISLDDLYNHLKVYEAKVQKKSNSNSQNIAFISSSKNSSGNKDDNNTCVSTSSTTFPTASANSNGSQIKFEDINQIDKDDMEEMDIKWSMALLSMRADKFWKRTGKKIIIQGSDVAGFEKSKVECFNCHKMGHFARECRAPKSQERGRKESYRQGSKAKEKTLKSLMAIDGVGWDWSYMANEGEDHALVADREVPSEFALMANTESKVFDNSLCSNECKKNTDSLNSKIKDLKSELSEANNYIYHYKLAVAQLEGRLTEYKEREVKYIEKIRILEMYRASNLKCIKILDKELEELKLEKDGLDGKLAGLLKASKNLDHLIESQRFDQVKEEVGYNVVPPLAADLYLSPKKDLSWTGLPEFVNDTVTDYSRPTPMFLKPKDSQTDSETNKQETPKKPQVKFAEQYRHSNKKPKVKGNQMKWNNLKSYQLGPEFVLKKKACYNCGNFSHLVNDCRHRVQRETSRSQNHVYMGLLHRFAGHRPHGAPIRPPNKSFGHRSHGPSMRPPNRHNGHRPHGPSMNPRKPNMNDARPNRSFFNQAPSYETRPFSKSLAVKTQNRAPWVEHKIQKRSNKMYYPRFTKVIIDYFITRKPSIPRRIRINWHYVRDDVLFSTIKVAYKEYYACATREVAPKPKASARKKKEFRNDSGHGGNDPGDHTYPEQLADPQELQEQEELAALESNAENLLPILSECEVTLKDKRDCDVLVSTIYVCDNHYDIFSDSKIDDDILVYDDDFKDIGYVEASLSDPEIVSVEEENVVHQAENDVYQEEEIDLEDISQIQDVFLREKLLSIIHLISNIESLNDNSTPDCVLNSFESDNFLSDNFSPKFKTFCDHSEETRSGNTTHTDNSLPEYDSFCFEIEPDQEKLINLMKNDISDNSSNDPLLEEADLFLASDNSISPGIENLADDSKGDIRFLEELIIDNSILSHESSDSNFEDNPSIPRPPPEPPDAETDAGEEIPVVMNDKDEDVSYSSFVFVIFAKVFSFLSVESEDTIFDPGISI